MSRTPRVIVNADDFGLSSTVNAGVMNLFEADLLSSATLMVNMPAADEACQFAQQAGVGDRIGLHINLSEGPALCGYPNSGRFTDEAGDMHLGARRPVRLARAEKQWVREEILAQGECLVAGGIVPSHADSHHHFHTAWPILTSIHTALSHLGIRALRSPRNLSRASRRGLKGVYKRLFRWRMLVLGLHTTAFFSDLNEFLAARERGNLTTDIYEVMIHPIINANGHVVDAVDGSELAPRLRRALTGVERCVYADVCRGNRQ